MSRRPGPPVVETLRVGLIGANPQQGWAAQAHLPVLATLPGVEPRKPMWWGAWCSGWWIVLCVVATDVTVLIYRVGRIDLGGQVSGTVLNIVKWHLLLDSVSIGHFSTTHGASLVIGE